jgi:hypothetical protein
MSSEAQNAANRRNARRSTGPRSAEGKQKSSQNALKWGLSSPHGGVLLPTERGGAVLAPTTRSLDRDQEMWLGADF